MYSFWYGLLKHQDAAIAGPEPPIPADSDFGWFLWRWQANPVAPVELWELLTGEPPPYYERIQLDNWYLSLKDRAETQWRSIRSVLLAEKAIATPRRQTP